MNMDFILDEDVLRVVEGQALFYPCSGNDLRVPIEIFSPYITDFWFVDRGYFSPGHQDTRSYGGDVIATRQRPVLEADNRYKFLDKDICGPPSWCSSNGDIEPCILSESYCHIQTGREIRIHRRRGYGFSAFRNETAIGKLGVFFYRGDSQGEGGSGNQWLRGKHLEEVFTKLVDRGLLVIDGSDGSPYERKTIFSKELAKAMGNASYKQLNPSQLIQDMNQVTDQKGRKFHCVGYAGVRYGLTMIWQVHAVAKSAHV